MERIKAFRKAILEVMSEYAEERKNAVNGLKYEIIVDKNRCHFQLVLLGWHEDERIHHHLFHIDIIDEKIWIQDDQTEIGVATLLVEKGIEKKDIVLAYFSEFHRQHTEFAVS